MPGKHNAGGCKCCNAFTCNSCNVITYVTVSGVTDPAGCPGGCTRINGTYVFRTVGTLVTTCRWTVEFAQYNCNLFGVSLYYLGGNAVQTCNSTRNRIIIDFSDNGSGGVFVTVTIVQNYADFSVFPPIAGVYTHVYRDSFASCSAAAGATLPLISTTFNCQDRADPGDFCGIGANAVVSVG